MDERHSEYCDEGLGIIQKKKERLAFMIRETAKRISLPKQSAQSCQAASRERGEEGGDQMGRLTDFFSEKKNDPNLC